MSELNWFVVPYRTVKLRTNTDKAFAVYASGGIDSSIVSILSKPKYIFSFLPKSKLVSDEEHYVDILASKMKHTQLVKTSNSLHNFLKYFIDMVYINEGPTTTLGAFAQYFLAREAKNHAIKITLSGIGADEFFNGYVRHAIAIQPNRFNSVLFKEYAALVEKSGIIRVPVSPDIAYSNLLNRNSTKNTQLQSLLKIFFSQYKSPLAAISIADFHFTLPPLLHTDDYINMAFSIESRSPFMDYRLVEFALGLPEDYKIHIHKRTNEIYTKYLLREAFKDILPKQIYNRKDKVGFTSNIADLLREQMLHVFLTSCDILQKAFPSHPYLKTPKDSLGQYISNGRSGCSQLGLLQIVQSDH